MSLPLSELSSSSSGGISGFIYLAKSACIESGKPSGSYTSGRIALAPSLSQLDLGSMTEEELADRIHSLAIENDELRAVLQHNNGLLENHFKDLSVMQETQRQRNEHLTKAHEKAKEVVRKLREKNCKLEKDLQATQQKLAEVETQLPLQEASRDESQEETKEEKKEPLRELVKQLKEEKRTLASQNQQLLEHINKVRSMSESEELIATVASSDEWSSSDLVSSEFGSASGKLDSTESKFNTELEILKVDLTQVKVESEQKDLLLQELRAEREKLENQMRQREAEMQQADELLRAAKQEADKQRQELEMEVEKLQMKCQQLQGAREQLVTEQTQQQSPNRKDDVCPQSTRKACGSQTDVVGGEMGPGIVDLTQQLAQSKLQQTDLEAELRTAKAETSKLKEQVELFDARYREAEENAKAFDLGSEDTMKQKYHAMKTQLWKYQQKEGEVRDKEEALLEKEGDWARLTQEKDELSQKLASVQLQLVEFQQRNTALENEMRTCQQELDSSKEALEEALTAKENLQSQLEQNATVHTKLDEYQTQAEALQQQLAEVNTEAESKLAELQRSHEEEKEALNQQLQEAFDEQDRAEHLRAQVCQLIQENHSLETKVSDVSEEYSNRKELYAQHINRMEQDHRTQCQEKDTEMEGVRKQLATNMEELKLSRRSYEQLLAQHEQMVGEYDSLVQNFQTTMKTGKQQKESEILDLHNQVDNLTAQLFTAEEAIQKKDDECNTAKERLQELSRQLEAVGVMQTQLEVYQSDFRVEREAREREHAEKNHLQEQIQKLQLDMQQMQDELDRHNEDQLTTMRLRHSGGGTDQHRSPPPQACSGHQGPEPWYAGFFNRRGPGEEAGSGDVAGGDVLAREERGGIQQSAAQGGDWRCTQCQQRFPDFDSLQMHAVECAGSQQQQQDDRPWCPLCGNYFPDYDTLQIHAVGCGN